MLINSMENTINLYDLNNISNEMPLKYSGHKSTFYGNLLLKCEFFFFSKSMSRPPRAIYSKWIIWQNGTHMEHEKLRVDGRFRK